MTWKLARLSCVRISATVPTEVESGTSGWLTGFGCGAGTVGSQTTVPRDLASPNKEAGAPTSSCPPAHPRAALMASLTLQTLHADVRKSKIVCCWVWYGPLLGVV